MKGKSTALLLLVIVAAGAAHEYATECPEEQTDDWRIEHLLRHKDCEKFYKCTFGKPVEYICPAGLHFNLATWECDWIHNVDCEGRNVPGEEPEKPEEPVDESEEEPVDNDDKDDNDKDDKDDVDDKDDKDKDTDKDDKDNDKDDKDDVDDKDDKDKDTDKDDKDTDKDDKDNDTNEKDDIDTDDKDTDDKDTDDKDTDDTDTDDNDTDDKDTGDKDTDDKDDKDDKEDGGGADPQPETQENGCPVDHNIHWLLPHECDCNKFYYCVWGELALRRCPAGLHFNTVLQVCDWPANAGCASSFNKHLEGRRAMLNYLS